MERIKSKAIRQFIFEQIEKSSQDIVRLTSKKIGISRQAVYGHINFLINHGMIIAEGSTRQKKYKLKPVTEMTFQVSKDLQEDVIWRNYIRPLLDKISPNILDICHYGFIEIINNVIDHSAGTLMTITIIRKPLNIRLSIFDNGVGIFKKIQTEHNLEDQSHAILELAKGKLTTDPEHHTGDGIFFSSRMFNRFSILSGKLYFAHDEIIHDWSLRFEEDDLGQTDGTLVIMEIDNNSPRTTKEVFDNYSAENDACGFSRTIVPVVLATYGDENLISRSQAKRLLARLENFREVILDFKKIETIGLAFADEIFRVFKLKNPRIHLMHINANEEVQKSILGVMQKDSFQYLSVKKVAELLGFHPETIKRWARDGKIEVQQTGRHGHIRIKWPLEKPELSTENEKLL
jgi:excisionase family DNA binding protein